MADIPKVDASKAVTVPLMYGSKGYHAVHKTVTTAISKVPVGEHIAKIKGHPMSQKALNNKSYLIALLGLALVLHGSQFKNLLLCTQVVIAFLFERVKGSVTAVLGDISVAREKLAADGPAEEPAKEAAEEKSNKHAKKRDAKTKNDKRSSSDTAKDDAETSKKMILLLDEKKLSAAAVEVLAAFMACLLVIHGGLVQKVAIAYTLVGLIADRLDGILEFPDHEDIKAWTTLLVRFALWVVVLSITLLAAPLALAMSASMLGARLVAENGFELANITAESKQGLIAAAGLAGFGTLYQLWTWSADGGIAWYFNLIYLPAVIAESILGLF